MLRIARDVVPGEADDAVADELEVGVAGGVPLAVAAGAVVGETVELGDEAVGRPEGVDFVDVPLALEEGVQQWAGESSLLDELVEAFLSSLRVWRGCHAAMTLRSAATPRRPRARERTARMEVNRRDPAARAVDGADELPRVRTADQAHHPERWH